MCLRHTATQMTFLFSQWFSECELSTAPNYSSRCHFEITIPRKIDLSKAFKGITFTQYIFSPKTKSCHCQLPFADVFSVLVYAAHIEMFAQAFTLHATKSTLLLKQFMCHTLHMTISCLSLYLHGLDPTVTWSGSLSDDQHLPRFT